MLKHAEEQCGVLQFRGPGPNTMKRRTSHSIKYICSISALMLSAVAIHMPSEVQACEDRSPSPVPQLMDLVFPLTTVVADSVQVMPEPTGGAVQ